MSYWGYHLLLNAHKCVPATIRTRSVIRDFANDLVKQIDMVPYGKPQIVMFGTGNKKGYTLVQLIETSNICAHFVEETDDFYLDVFSCKDFKPEVVKDVVDYYFRPREVKTQLMARDATKLIELR
jgi:S-adenosylmethionine/arginine decarboxylase-like enzyme